MTIIAIDENNKVLFPYQVNSNVNAKCRTCGHSVIPIKGYYKASLKHVDKLIWIEPFWQHKKLEGINCPDRSPKGSFFHRSLQSIFKIDQREFKRPDINRKADVLLKNCHCILEIQSSTMASDNIYQRVKDWRSIGYDVIWVFRSRTIDDHRQKRSVNTAYYDLRKIYSITKDGQQIKFREQQTMNLPIFYIEEHNGGVYQYNKLLGYDFTKFDENKFYNAFIKENMLENILLPINEFEDEWSYLSDWQKVITHVFYKMYGPKGVKEYLQYGHVDFEKFLDLEYTNKVPLSDNSIGSISL
jgi:hypothetical protein